MTSAFNISKETAKATVLKINGRDPKDTEIFFGGINQPDINAVFLCEKFFNLPGYLDMELEFEKYAQFAPKEKL